MGSYPPGATQLGIQDMAGNLKEWIGDWWGNYSIDPQTDPLGTASSTGRVIRGSYWYDDAELLRCACRNLILPNTMDYYFGFRISRTITP